MTPSRSPIHFTNELEVEASPETVWAVLVDPRTWPAFYPGVEHVRLLDGHHSLRLGTRFETNLAGQDVFASVQEFQPRTRIAWGGYPKASEASRAYHAWIITPTPKGSHLWTEETMRGPLWNERAKQDRQQGRHCPLGVLVSGLGQTSPAAQEVTSQLLARWDAAVLAGINSMQETGKISRRLDAKRTAAALVAAIQGGATNLMSTGSTTSLEAALDTGIDYLRQFQNTRGR
ncbi:SRPBCC domain-containing protein [Amycolatopsis sp. cmx-4-83]|uniref:SRPBCC domain-containing protein n=1 Tax=Amycolatopsis sp. cmx-4-83 TaxID=2790940 RepID=UPI00397A1D97